MLLLLANVVVGITGGDFNAACQEYMQARHRLADVEKQRGSTEATLETAQQAREAAMRNFNRALPAMTTHFFLGVTATLVTILVNSISVTYFVGTSRWSKEVVDTYHLAPELAEESARIKRRSFPWALLGIFTMLLVAGLGGAADPRGANLVHSAHWVQPHFLTALGSIGLIGWSFLMQGECLADHFQLIERIMAEVRRIRAQARAGEGE